MMGEYDDMMHDQEQYAPRGVSRLKREAESAYKRGRASMREEAAKIADKSPNSAIALSIAAQIRALPE